MFNRSVLVVLLAIIGFVAKMIFDNQQQINDLKTDSAVQTTVVNQHKDQFQKIEKWMEKIDNKLDDLKK